MDHCPVVLEVEFLHFNFVQPYSRVCWDRQKLVHMVVSGQFRQDLFNRLATLKDSPERLFELAKEHSLDAMLTTVIATLREAAGPMFRKNAQSSESVAASRVLRDKAIVNRARIRELMCRHTKYQTRYPFSNVFGGSCANPIWVSLVKTL